MGMFETYFLIDTVTVGKGHRTHTTLIPILQVLLRRGMRNVTDAVDQRLGMTVFSDYSGREIFIIEISPS